MKNPFKLAAAMTLAAVLVTPIAHAAIITKADNTNSLDQTASWSGGTAPGGGDVATWSGAYSGGPATGVVTNSLYAVFLPGITPTWGGINVGALTGSCLTQSPIFNTTTSVSNITAASEAVVNGFNLVTITCNSSHRFEVGEAITISGVTPAGYNGTYIIAGVPAGNQFTYTNVTGSLAAGTAFGTASANMYIGGNGTGNGWLTIGASGITVASGAPGVVINTASNSFSGNQTWNLAPGTVVRFAANGGAASGKAVTSGADGTIEITGGGVASLNPGGASGFTDAGGFTGFTGNWQADSGATLRTLRNGNTAFGSGTINLNGGTLAVGGMSGDTGNWTWNNTINLNASTTSYISEQNVTGSGRYLLLSGTIQGSGNVVFTEPLVAATAFTSQDLGFILSGSDTMSGTVTIGGPNENGVAGRQTFVRVGGNATGTATTTGAGSLGSLGSATSVINNGVLSFTLVGGYSLPSAITGTGTLRIGSQNTATGTGGFVGDAYQVITLTGANTYSGPTLINAGTLTLAAGASLPNTPSISIWTNSVNGGAVINTFDVSALAGGFTTASGQSLDFNGGAVNGSLTLGAGSTNIFAPGSSNVIGNLNITGNLNLAGGNNTFVMDINNTPANDTITVSGALTASGVTTLQFVPPGGGLNAGTYTLITAASVSATPANFAIQGLVAGPRPQTFTINVTSTSVQLVVVGNPGNLLWVGDGTNNLWNTAITSNWLNQITLSKDVFYANDNVAFDDTGSNTPAINLVGSLLPTSVNFSNNVNSYTLAGAGQIAGAATLNVSGTGMVTLLNSNTFTGNIVVGGGGILAITNEMALNQPTNANSQSLTLNNGGALLVTNDVMIGANTNRGIIIGTAGGTLSVINGANLTVSSVIGDLTGVSVLTKTGNGMLNLNGNNNYGGGTIINGGAVVCGNSHAMGLAGSWSPGFTLQSGTVDVAGQSNYSSSNGTEPNYLFYGPNAATTPIITFDGNPGATMNFIDSVPGHAGVVLFGGSTVNQVVYYNGANNPNKAIMSVPWYGVGSGAVLRTYVVNVDPTTASPVGLEIQGQMSSLGYDGKVATVQKTGAGVLEISSTNYFPNLQVTAGTLLVNNLWALGWDRSPNNVNPVTLTNNVGSGSPQQLTVDGGTVDLNGFSPAIGALSDNGGITTGVITNNGATASALTLGYSISNIVNNASYAGVIADGAKAIALIKNGTNTQALAGLNTYSGTTLVNDGALLVNTPGQIGLGGVGSTVTVAGGTLGGSGTINAPTVVQAGGTLAPAVGAATTVALTVSGNLTLGGTNVMNVNKDLATNDLVTLTSGTVNYGGVLVVSTNLMTSTTLALGDSFKLFNAPAATGNFSSISGSPGAGLAWSFNPTTGVLSVVTSVVSPVPITSSYSGGVLSLSWPGGQGWILQSQTNLASNPWVNLTSGSVNSTNITVDPTKPSVFYRLMHP